MSAANDDHFRSELEAEDMMAAALIAPQATVVGRRASGKIVSEGVAWNFKGIPVRVDYWHRRLGK